MPVTLKGLMTGKPFYEVTLHEDDVSVTAILCLLCKTSILWQGIDGLGKVGLQIFDNLLHYNRLINGSSMISQLARQSDQGTYLSFDSCVALLNTSFSGFFFYFITTSTGVYIVLQATNYFRHVKS